ncbi:MAG: hypothetical protein ACXW2C_04565 [Acidimicrobiia bacterium]
MVAVALPPQLPPAFPRRDARARAALDDAARAAQPLVLARDRVLAVSGALGALLPAAGVQRGTVVSIDGELGSGATSLTFELAAAATRVGEWAAMVDPDGTLGGLAAGEAGVVLERFAVVRGVPPARWATVVAALLDGVTTVVTAVPRSVRVGDARRLVARARERSAVLVTVGAWPAEAALRVHADGVCWSRSVDSPALFGPRSFRVSVSGRGVAARAPVEILARVG